MMKIALGIEYNGQDYSGWQKQDHAITVQATLEQALSEIADEEITVVCAGRTDTGVHAIQQVVHFETSAKREDHGWVLGTNTKLPGNIAVTWAKEVEEDFHARFCAEQRTYQYLIINRRSRPAILNGLASWECRSLDLEKMKTAASCFVGEHDFTSYRAVACQAKSPIRTVYNLTINKMSDTFVITICANAFLHHMVRNIAGVLMTIGYGGENISWAKEVLDAKDRTAGGVTAEPDGLYLVDVKYPARFNIPKVKTLLEQMEAIQ